MCLNLIACNIDMDGAVQGIYLYKNRPEHLGFLSRCFDSTWGERRANTYLELLKRNLLHLLEGQSFYMLY